MNDIDRLYGKSFLVAQASKSKLSSWTIISNNDAMGIFKLTNFLKQCLTAMSDICDLQCLNLSEKNQEIVSLLPDYIARHWNGKTTEYQLAHGKFPPFSKFVEFMELESAKANNPVTSANALKQANKSKQPASSTSQSKPKPNSAPSGGKAFSHQTTSSNATSDKPKVQRECVFCKSTDHFYISKCKKFKELSVDERWKSVQSNKLCHRCLGPKHQQSTCTKEWKCGKCQKLTHHTLLHRDCDYSCKCKVFC